MAKTPLENYILKTFGQRFKEKKAWQDLEKFGTKLPSGGHMWTGKDKKGINNITCNDFKIFKNLWFQEFKIAVGIP